MLSQDWKFCLRKNNERSFSNPHPRSWRCGCFVTCICYQMITTQDKKTAAPSWPDPYASIVDIQDIAGNSFATPESISALDRCLCRPCCWIVPHYLQCYLATLRTRNGGSWDWIVSCIVITAYGAISPGRSVKNFNDDVIKWKHFTRHWPLWWEFTGHQQIPLTKASDAELWCFLWSAPELPQWIQKFQNLKNQYLGDEIHFGWGNAIKHDNFYIVGGYTLLCIIV